MKNMVLLKKFLIMPSLGILLILIFIVQEVPFHGSGMPRVTVMLQLSKNLTRAVTLLLNCQSLDERETKPIGRRVYKKEKGKQERIMSTKAKVEKRK